MDFFGYPVQHLRIKAGEGFGRREGQLQGQTFPGYPFRWSGKK